MMLSCVFFGRDTIEILKHRTERGGILEAYGIHHLGNILIA